MYLYICISFSLFYDEIHSGLQKSKLASPNVEVIETFRLTQNKYIQIVRVSTRYYSIAVCKDTITMLGELNGEDLTIPETGTGNDSEF